MTPKPKWTSKVYTYPGHSQAEASIERWRKFLADHQIKPGVSGPIQELIASELDRMDEAQDIWGKAQREVWGIERAYALAIWHALYGNEMPYFAAVDTMEIAHMRARTFAVLDAISDARYDEREQTKNDAICDHMGWEHP